MSRLHRVTDKIKVKVDSLIVTISPLTLIQKKELQAAMVKAAAGNVNSAMDAVSLALKYAVKDIQGITYEDEFGNEQNYKLVFDDRGELEDSCIDDLLNLEESQKLNTICSSLIGSFKGKFVDHEGNELEGVSIIPKAQPSEEGKK